MNIEGWRKVIVTFVALLFEAGGFALMIALGKADTATYVAFCSAVTATLGAFVTGNVISKNIEKNG